MDKNGNSVEEIPFYRLYNPKSGRYVFTRFMTERDRLIKKGYKDEGTGWQLSTNTGYITLKEMFDRSKEAEKEIQNTNETEEKFGIGREAYVYQFENTLTKDRISLAELPVQGYYGD